MEKIGSSKKFHHFLLYNFERLPVNILNNIMSLLKMEHFKVWKLLSIIIFCFRSIHAMDKHLTNFVEKKNDTTCLFDNEELYLSIFTWAKITQNENYCVYAL